MTVRRRTRKPKGTKRVSYELIIPDSTIGEPIYLLLRELVMSFHEHLKDARIGLAWALSWKPDVDGRVKLGMAKNLSDLDREYAEFDFIILLKKSFWQDLKVKPDQRRALLDHELCHCEVKLDERTGEPVYDERGRRCYRLRRHDLEEFSAIVERYGTWKGDIEQFAASLNRSARGSWQPCATCQDPENPNPGFTKQTDGRLKRCSCWTAWRERHAEAVPA